MPLSSNAKITAGLQALADILDHAVVIIDREGTVLAGNQAAAQLLGLDAKPENGPDWNTRLPTPVGPTWHSAVTKVLDGGIATLHPGFPGVGDMSIPGLETVLLPLPDGTDAVLCVGREDLEGGDTRDKAVPDTLKLASSQSVDKAKRASLAKSAFIAKITHDMRNPLNSVVGAVDVLKKNSRLQTDTDAQALLTLIERNCKFMLELIPAILDYSKIEAGRWSVNPRHFEPQELLNRAREVFGRRAEELGLQFKTRIHTNLPEHIYADRIVLEQVLYNLLSNALKFTEEGHVEVGLGVYESEEDPRQCKLELVVSDTGTGIEQENLEAIFEPYYQGECNEETRRGGSGLGLSICEELVRELNGRMDVASEPGVGSEFRVRVPLDQGSRESGVFWRDGEGS